MLKHRLLMSALLIPGAIGLFVWDHSYGSNAAPVLFVVLLAISARCVWELVVLSRAAGFQPSLALCWIWTWSLLFAVWATRLFPSSSMSYLFQQGHVPLGWFAFISVSILLMAVIRFRPPQASADVVANAFLPVGQQFVSAAIEFFIIHYIGMMLAVTAQMRWFQEDYFALGALVIATKMGDVGAYTFGRLIGGPKMTPRLSPGKTWSGGVGHVVTAGLSSAAWLCWLGHRVNDQWQNWAFSSAILFGVVVGFAGLVGDLAESLIKRDVGVKDAPALFPGFGGLLDVMDSLLLAGPVAVFMWHWAR